MAWSAIQQDSGSSSTGGLTWTEVTADQVMSSANGYIANDTSAITFDLPATSAVGDEIEIVGKGSGGWDIAQAAGQTIHFGSTSSTTGAGGSVASTIQYQAVIMRCIIANTDWEIISANGSLTIT